MKRAVISGFSGTEWSYLAKKTWPLMEQYAYRCHASFSGVSLRQTGRPPAWGKLTAIAAGLAENDEVLWLDADVSVETATKNVFDEIADGVSSGMCLLDDSDGRGHFNTGVWLVRRKFMPHIVSAAMMDEFVNHRWWEQAAVIAVIEKEQVPVQRLQDMWNVWSGSGDVQNPQFRHACGLGSVESRIRWLGLE